MFKRKHKESHDSENETSSVASAKEAGANESASADKNNSQTAEKKTNMENEIKQDVNQDKEQADIGEKINELEMKLAEAEDKCLRLRAEFENYKKRTFRDISDARFNSRFDTVLPFLSVLDHFKLAVDAAEKKSDFKVLHDGMKIILSEFQKALDDIGIEIIDATGKKFDPAIHEAVAKENSDTVEEGFVISQWRCGYKMGDRLLRPCAVVVSSGPHEAESDASQTIQQDKTSEQSEKNLPTNEDEQKNG